MHPSMQWRKLPDLWTLRIELRGTRSTFGKMRTMSIRVRTESRKIGMELGRNLEARKSVL